MSADSPPPPPIAIPAMPLSLMATLPPPEYHSARARVAGHTEHGLVLLCVHRFRVILQRHRSLFEESTLQQLYEDLAELAGERGELTVEQQLYVLIRMRQTYRFLQCQ